MPYLERAKRSRDGDDAAPYYTVFDIPVLHNEVMRYVFPGVEGHVPAIIQRKAMAMVALAAIMCGTDFTQFKGIRFSEMLEIVRDLCDESMTNLVRMHGAWSADDNELMSVAGTISQLLDTTANRLRDVPRRWKNCASLHQPDVSEVTRTLWNLAYWSRPFHERTNVCYWGFPFVETGIRAPGSKPRAVLEEVEAPPVAAVPPVYCSGE